MWGIYFLALASSPQPVWLNDKVLDCIKQIESGGDNNAISVAGAVGPYQFMPRTWEEASGGKPLKLAFDEKISRDVCFSYVGRIYTTITKWKGEPATMIECVAAYNGGMGRLKLVDYDISMMSKETRNYVEKFLMVYQYEEPGKDN